MIRSIQGYNDKFRDFWSQKETPLHRHDTPEWYERYASEMNLVFRAVGYTGGRVLETGCGTGSLFPFLEITREGYVGTDVSEKMLARFRAAHPELELVCTDAATYRRDDKFVMIYSNGVVQYFAPERLRAYVRNSWDMLAPGGVLYVGNVLWRDLREHYIGGDLQRRPQATARITRLRHNLRYAARVLRGQDRDGWWYSPRDLLRMAPREAEVTVFGSLFYPYRFHVAIRRPRSS